MTRKKIIIDNKPIYLKIKEGNEEFHCSLQKK
jgi:hypothetical protein